MATHTITARQVGSFIIYDYSPPSFFVVGYTKPYIEAFKALNGKFSKLEVAKGSGSYVAGWIFSKKRLPAVEQYLTTGQLPVSALTPPPVAYAIPTMPIPIPQPRLQILPAPTPKTPSELLFEAVDKFTTAVAAYRTAVAKVYTQQMGPDTVDVLISGPKALADAALAEYLEQWPESYLKMRTELGDYLAVVLSRMGQL